jgi:uncharacterized membrane protein YphA (DoxX/SURF4 family)
MPKTPIPEKKLKSLYFPDQGQPNPLALGSADASASEALKEHQEAVGGELPLSAERNAYDPEGYAWGAWIFLQGLGWVYLLAFFSLWLQIEPLVGEQGLLPYRDLLARYQVLAEQRMWGWTLYTRWMPSLLWLDPSDRGLRWLCLSGILGAILLILRIAPRLVLLFLWMAYLSLVKAGQDFLAFQWDNLLLEAGFLAIFLAPSGLYVGYTRLVEPPRMARWLLWFLLIRLIFLSGWVKLQSGDVTWSHLTALAFHYETQPLPTLLAWYAHQLPMALHRIATAATLGIELAAPFLLLLGIFSRRVAALSMMLLMFLILLTGNYGFFNLLSLALLALTLDDAFYASFLPFFWQRGFTLRKRKITLLGRVVLLGCVAPLFYLAALQTAGQIVPRSWLEPQRWPLLATVAPFRSVNRYGLFAVMTTQRPEIMLEASQDGQRWLPYRFRFKPDDPKKAPVFAFFHMPRLDWQLWFAALSGHERQPWLRRLLQKLRHADPAALSLLHSAPFTEKPRFIRSIRMMCRFSSFAERHRDDAWWRCQRLSP